MIADALEYAARFRGDLYAPTSAVAHLVALADEVERLRELAGGARDAWLDLAGTGRNGIVREQSNDLCDALGALSTQLLRGGT